MTVAFDARLKAGETLTYRLFPPAVFESFSIPKDGVNDKVYPIFKKALFVGKGGNSGGECWKKVTKTLTFDYMRWRDLSEIGLMSI